MRKQIICAAMLLTLHCGFAHAQPPMPDSEPIGQKLLASDGADGNGFGGYVSVDGDTAVIGAGGSDTVKGVDSGAAYVFVREDDVWKEKQKLIPSDGRPESLFGAVAFSGDTVLIGAAWDDAKGEKSGSVYVFVRGQDGVWMEQQKLIPSDGQAWDIFGTFISLDGDTALISAHGDDDIAYNAGSAYIFVRGQDGVWREQQKLTASDGATDDDFGYKVALNNGTALIGAVFDDDKGTDSGSTYVFVHGQDGVWRQQQKLTSSDGEAGDLFNTSVSLDGDTALIGMIKDDDKGTDSGSVYVFVRGQDSVWREQQKLTADDGTADSYFGASISLDGDTALIGASLDQNSGSAYVFVRASDGTWNQQHKLTADDGADDDQSGVSVSLAALLSLVLAVFPVQER